LQQEKNGTMDIYEKIKNAVENANIKGLEYKNDYPRDIIRPDFDPIENEDADTVAPLAEALKVIAETIKTEATVDDDIEIVFQHIPSEEGWRIEIGDGR